MQHKQFGIILHVGRAQMRLVGMRPEKATTVKKCPKNRSKHSRLKHGAGPVFEALEQRLLLSTGLIPCIDLIEADNRGLVVMHVTQDLVASTVDEQSVQLLGAGLDGILGTDDDNALDSVVTYDAATREIRIQTTEVDADAGYGIRVLGDDIRGTNGNALDAEFNSLGAPTGNGVEGGTLLVYSDRNAGNQIARVTTNLGSIDIELFNDQTPLTVANFLRYANEGFYDRTFFHRIVEDFVIQGGGFFAEPGFTSIPDFPAVQNEPGISNLRGTVAMAKIGGNPNSATNEWFFNLSDNSGNLDSQNGGFTVFAEIINAEGFEVLDLLAVNRDKVNAQSQGGAFTDVPVLDSAVVAGNGGQVTPEDLVRITRIASLVGLTTTPFESLEVSATTSVTNTRAGVGVRLYALDQGTDVDLEGMLRVKFGTNRNIESITIRDGASVGRLAIEITGATSIRTLRDLRAGSADLAFIVSSARISQIDLRGSVLGMNINDVVLPGGTQIPDDLDGDGTLDDAVAIYVPEGFVDRFRIRGDLTGDVLMPGGAGQVRVDGMVHTTEFRLGNEATPEGMSVSARFNTLDQASLLSDAPIRSLRAVDWQNNTQSTSSVRTPSIVDLRISGGRGVDGDFHARLDLSGVGATLLGTLGRARIAGQVNNSTWNITGDVGRVRVDGDITQWDMDVSGSLESLTAERLQIVNLDIGESIPRGVKAWSWRGGNLEVVRELGSLELTGNKRADVDGDFSGVDVTINEQGNAGARIDRFRIAGDVVDVEAEIRSAFRSIEIGGTLRDSSIQTAGDVGFIKTGDSRGDSTLSIDGVINTVTVGDWVGTLFLGKTGRIRIQGGMLGDFFVRNVSDMVVEGDVEAQDFRFNSADRVMVMGDVINSRVWFNVSTTDRSVELFDIRGEMRSSQFFADANVGIIMATAMTDSAIYVGATADNAPTGFPNENGDLIDQAIMLERLIVTGFADTSVSFDNTIVAAGQLGFVSISYPEHFLTQSPKYGLAASSIGSVFTRLETGKVIAVQSPRVSPAPIGSYQIRVGFDAPVVEG